MEKAYINKEINKYILDASMAKESEIQEDTLIFDEGLLDSMGLLFLIEFIHDEFGVEVNDEELNPKNFESINRIINFVYEKLKLSV